jgi:hypothetical protein
MIAAAAQWNWPMWFRRGSSTAAAPQQRTGVAGTHRDIDHAVWAEGQALVRGLPASLPRQCFATARGISVSPSS